jgi:hypothetical protein
MRTKLKPAPLLPSALPRLRECVPCEIPPFCRNNFFTGKLLTERDLKGEQTYFIDKARLHNLSLHGWGVVCGLKVKPHPWCPDLRIIVGPGLAIDACGREIQVGGDIEIPLPELPKSPPRPEEGYPEQGSYEPTPPSERYEPASEGNGRSRYGTPSPAPMPPPVGGTYGPGADKPDTDQYQQAYDGSPQNEPGPPHYPGSDTPGEEEPEKPGVGRRPPGPIVDLYLCVRYAECDTEFMPAPFDECACSGDPQKPNRVCESFKFELLTECPKEWEAIRASLSECEADDCRDLYQSILDYCPAPQQICVPLAVIRGYTPGQPVIDQSIDNWTYRPLLPSVRLLDKLIHCILGKLPARTLTAITDINWTHGGEYHCNDFPRLFVGSEAAPKWFEITFSGPVKTRGLSDRSFQAVAVRYVKRSGEAHDLELVPARISLSPDRTRAMLRINPEYAERQLNNVSFDLYITLKCNVILDDAGNPVDGDLLGRSGEEDDYVVAPPTGDGIPGGTFESWLRVRR